MSRANQEEKPKCLALMPFNSLPPSYLSDFKSHFILDELHVPSRALAIPAIITSIKTSGPYSVFIILMGTGPYKPFTPEFFTPFLPHLKLIVSASAGYNEFPIDWMTENKIWFCNTRYAVSEPTADMAMWMILTVVRGLEGSAKGVRGGKWRGEKVFSEDPSGLVLGIIGMGAIGKHLARKALAFNLRIHYTQPRSLPLFEEQKYNATYHPNLPSLLSVSDIISISCPLNPNTHHLFSHAEFSLMKDGVFIINTARGAIIDEEALISALESGKVKRAGLDVFEKEPDINKYFLESEKVVVQPHMGGLTAKARADAERECVENIKSLFATGRPVAPVNEVVS